MLPKKPAYSIREDNQGPQATRALYISVTSGESTGIFTCGGFLLSRPPSRSSLGDGALGKDEPGRPIRVNLGRTRDEDILNMLGLLIVASENKYNKFKISHYNIPLESLPLFSF